jgi:hypothetical protein
MKTALYFPLPEHGTINLVSIVVVVIAQPFSLLTPYAITYRFLLAIAFVVADHALIPSAIPRVTIR